MNLCLRFGYAGTVSPLNLSLEALLRKIDHELTGDRAITQFA